MSASPADALVPATLHATARALLLSQRKHVTLGAGAMQEAIVEQYNGQLRDIREAGLADELSNVRAVLRELRDEERAPEGSVQVAFREFIVFVHCHWIVQNGACVISLSAFLGLSVAWGSGNATRFSLFLWEASRLPEQDERRVQHLACLANHKKPCKCT